MAAFGLFFGRASFRAALYPLSFLWLTVPLSPSLMDSIGAGLQRGSAGASYAILRLLHIPVFRQGMKFSLPGLDLEIAPECSGIRSSLIFFLVGILSTQIYLQSGWRRLVLIDVTIPISIFKNAVRIDRLSLLSIYVDRAFLTGPIHHQ